VVGIKARKSRRDIRFALSIARVSWLSLPPVSFTQATSGLLVAAFTKPPLHASHSRSYSAVKDTVRLTLAFP
jgi:hypothetical protein